MSTQQQAQQSIPGPEQSPLPNKPQQLNNEEIIPNDLSSGQQEETPNTYLQKLLGKYIAHTDSVQFFTFSKYQQFHDEIMQGRYEIRQIQWSAQEQKMKANQNQHSRNSGQVVGSRNKMGNQQKLGDSQIKENEKASKEMSEEQRISFIKRIQREKKQLQRKKQENALLMQEKRKQQQRKNKQMLQKEENEKRIKKQQQISQRLKLLEQAQKKKEEEFKSQTLILKNKMKEKTLVDKIQQNYHQKQNQSLQQRKKRLSEIRMLHKPIDRSQLEAHAQKLEKLHLQRASAATAAENSQKSRQKPTVAFYKSIFYQRIKQQQKIFTDKRNEEELSKLKQKRDKLKKFSEHIKSNFKPQIDEEKVQQIKFRSVNLRNKSLSSKEHQTPKKLGLRYLQYSKLKVENQKLLVSNSDQTQEDQEDKPKKYDYLAELRKMNKNRASQSAHDFLNKLDRQGLSKDEKTKKIFEFTARIEQAAKRKQQLNKFGSKIEDGLDTLYLQAIHAKLGLLQDQD